MALKIVKHNGLFYAFDTCDETVVLVEATEEELIDWYAKKAYDDAKHWIKQGIKNRDLHKRMFANNLQEILEKHIPENCDDEDWNQMIFEMRLKYAT